MDEDEEPSSPSNIPFRSIEAKFESFVRFINTTPHTVTLFWLDYQGKIIDYGDLPPRGYKEVNTFHTHPWVFVNKKTGDRYLVNQGDVFFPEPWFVNYRGTFRTKEEGLQKVERTNVYIVLPMFTLQQLSLRAIKNRLTYDVQAFLLDVPRRLQLELFKMLPRRPLPA